MPDFFQKKIFVAIPVAPPLPGLHQVCVKLKKSFKQDWPVQFLPKETWHITLKFWGMQPLSKIQELMDALQTVAVNTAPFSVEIKNISAFADPRSARVIWAGVQNTKELRTLAQKVTEITLMDPTHTPTKATSYTQGDAPNPEALQFIPHVSLVRLKNPQSVESLIAPWARKRFGELHVDHIILFESETNNYRVQYTALQSFALSGAGKSSVEDFV